MTEQDTAETEARRWVAVPAEALAVSLARVPVNRSALVVVRHSLRDRPDDDRPGFEAPLTAAGVDLAERAGALLERPLTRLLSSPAPRCVETARALARGQGRALAVETLDALKEPAAFALDERRAGRYFVEHGARAWVEALVTEPEQVGARDCPGGTRRLMALLCRQPPAPGDVLLAVTHDTVLASLLHGLAGECSFEPDFWPLMLEGLVAWFEDDVLHWCWRDHGGTWPLPAAAS